MSVFRGTDVTRWRTRLETYRRVSLGETWPGIALDVQAYGGSIEKLFTLEPGADPSLIQMRIQGADRVDLASDGSLLVATGADELKFTPPFGYQDHPSGRQEVSVQYRVAGSAYGFALGDYDRNLRLVIDPLLQATYLGGSTTEQTNALAVHPTSGDLYVAGTTRSADFPGTAGGVQPLYAFEDAFVARFNSSLTTLLQATYLGGSSFESAHAVVIHPVSGEVLVAGRTNSPDFPGRAGGAQPTYGGIGDAFVARLSSSLTQLFQATYLGGSFPDAAHALAVHPAGEVFVAGFTVSTNFPGTTGGAQPASGGLADGFIARLNANLTMLAQSTYLGGSAEESAWALAFDPTSGEAYVAGETASSDFPGTAGGAQPNGGAPQDAFVARLNPSLTALNQATYLGGSGFDSAFQVGIHPLSREAYVVGFTTSTDLPAVSGGVGPTAGGIEDGFAARLNASLTALLQSTYLGGTSIDSTRALAFHPSSGEVYVAGGTQSTDIPGTAGGLQPNLNGERDAFVMRLHPSLTTVLQSTYLGGTSVENAYALAVHAASQEVYVAGITASSDFPGTAGGAQPSNGGGDDVFLARLTADLAGGPAPTPTPAAPATAVPTLSRGMLLLFFLALLSVALLTLRRTV